MKRIRLPWHKLPEQNLDQRRLKRRRMMESSDFDDVREYCYRRSGLWCERCFAIPVSDIHHLPEGYEVPIGSETPGMLRAVCNNCHQFVHRKTCFDTFRFSSVLGFIQFEYMKRQKLAVQSDKTNPLVKTSWLVRPIPEIMADTGTVSIRSHLFERNWNPIRSPARCRDDIAVDLMLRYVEYKEHYIDPCDYFRTNRLPDVKQLRLLKKLIRKGRKSQKYLSSKWNVIPSCFNKSVDLTTASIFDTTVFRLANLAHAIRGFKTCQHHGS